MQSFKFENVEVTVRRATVRDGLHAQIITNRAMANETDGTLGWWNVFGDLCSQVETWKGLPFDPTTLHEKTQEEVYAAYQEYMKLPRKVHELWKAAIDRADAPASEDVAPNASSAGNPEPKRGEAQRSA